MQTGRTRDGIVKLTQSSSTDPQDTGLQPVANPPCWASRTAVSLNSTIPLGPISDVTAAEFEAQYYQQAAVA